MIRLLPPSILLVVALAGAAMTSVVYRAENAADRIRFETVAQAAADRVVNRVRQHIALLVSTHAFFAATDEEVSREALARFTASLGLEEDYEGIRGIGYARLIRTGEEAETERDIAAAYGIDRVVWPDTEMEQRTPIVLMEPRKISARNAPTLRVNATTAAVKKSKLIPISTGSAKNAKKIWISSGVVRNSSVYA